MTAAMPGQAAPWRAAWMAFIAVTDPDRDLSSLAGDDEADPQWVAAWEAAAQAAIAAQPQPAPEPAAPPRGTVVVTAPVMPDLSTTGERTIDVPPGSHGGKLPPYCGCCGCLSRYCICSCCCCSRCCAGRAGASGPRGNSYANGASVNNGPRSPWSWRGGFQGARPVTHWDFTEGRPET